MKKLLVLVAVLLCFTIPGCSKAPSLAGKLVRDEALPTDLVSQLAGAPMKAIRDTKDEAAGAVSWAWEEESGDAKLLLVEIRLPPEDSTSLYRIAGVGAEALTAPEGSQVCADSRAMHILCGSFYVRVSLLGFPQEEDAEKQLTARLVSVLTQIR